MAIGVDGVGTGCLEDVAQEVEGGRATISTLLSLLGSLAVDSLVQGGGTLPAAKRASIDNPGHCHFVMAFFRSLSAGPAFF